MSSEKLGKETGYQIATSYLRNLIIFYLRKGKGTKVKVRRQLFYCETF